MGFCNTPGQGQVAPNSIQMGLLVSSCHLIIPNVFSGQSSCIFRARLFIFLSLLGLSEIYQQSLSICSHQPFPAITDILQHRRTAVLGKQREARKDKHTPAELAFCGVVTRVEAVSSWGQSQGEGRFWRSLWAACCAAHMSSVCASLLSCDTSGAGSPCS